MSRQILTRFKPDKKSAALRQINRLVCGSLYYLVKYYKSCVEHSSGKIPITKLKSNKMPSQIYSWLVRHLLHIELYCWLNAKFVSFPTWLRDFGFALIISQKLREKLQIL